MGKEETIRIVYRDSKPIRYDFKKLEKLIFMFIAGAFLLGMIVGKERAEYKCHNEIKERDIREEAFRSGFQAAQIYDCIDHALENSSHEY